jgi:hypothetical protein
MKIVYKRKKHIDWNWERSKEDLDRVRYHFVVVDNQNRRNTMNRILEQLQMVNEGIITIREYEGRVVETNLKWFFGSYDSYTAPKMIDFKTLGFPIRKDKKLYERKKGNIEDYVSNRYEKI